MAATLGIPRRWGVADSAEIYAVRAWGGGYFTINDAGNVSVTPDGPDLAPIDMKELVDELVARGIQLPILHPLHRHPARRIERAVRRVQRRDPRVRLQRPVPRRVPDQGQPEPHRRRGDHRVRPAVPLRPRGRQQARAARRSWRSRQDDEALIICNGYKDEEYIETALLASKMGKTVILVVEKPTELDAHPPTSPSA